MSQRRKDFEYSPHPIPTFWYWVYASPISGQYYATRDHKLVIFDSEELGHHWVSFDHRLKQMVGHWLTNTEVRKILDSGVYKKSFWVEPWGGNHLRLGEMKRQIFG